MNRPSFSFPHGQNPVARVPSQAHLVKCSVCGTLILNLDNRCHVCRAVQPVAWHDWAFNGVIRGGRVAALWALGAALLWGMFAWHHHVQRLREDAAGAGAAPTAFTENQ